MLLSGTLRNLAYSAATSTDRWELVLTSNNTSCGPSAAAFNAMKRTATGRKNRVLLFHAIPIRRGLE